MTKSEIFKAAHKLAKTFEGNYRACFSLALREVLATSKGDNMKFNISIVCDNDISKELYSNSVEVSSIEEVKSLVQKEFDKISGFIPSLEAEKVYSTTGYPIGYFEMEREGNVWTGAKTNKIARLNFEKASNGLVAMNHARFMINIFNVA